MAIRYPLYLSAPPGDPYQQLIIMNQAGVDAVNAFAPYAYGNSTLGPSAKLEVNTANGTAMSGQPFVDTYYVAGSYVTRVDRYATEAETPDIAMVTENYSRIRINYDSVTMPTGDTNNTQFPLYVWDETGGSNEFGTMMQLRAMSRQDFIDTFVLPALEDMSIWDATTNKEQQGTYFLTTSNAPSNASLVSATPVATNREANIAAYTAGGIPEVTAQTINVNYYLAYVNYPATAWDIYDATLGTYDLPVYFDSATETIRQHTPTTWANLLGPFLRYYLATPGSGYEINYSLSSGTQRGSTYTDTRVTPTGTGYNTRFVNADDYRSQEFPTGTASVISGNTKRFYISKGSSSTYSASANPSVSVNEGQQITFTLSTTNVADGSSFSYLIDGITAADISAGSLTGSVTVSGGSGSTQITLATDMLAEVETATCTFTIPGGTRQVSVPINDVETVSLEGTVLSPEMSGAFPLSDGSILMGWTIKSDGTVADYNDDRFPTDVTTGHADWNSNAPSPTGTYYVRASIHSQSDPGSQSFASSPSALNTWLALTSSRSFLFTDNRAAASYGLSDVVLKIEIATDSGGSNIVATGYYQNSYEGGA